MILQVTSAVRRRVVFEASKYELENTGSLYNICLMLLLLHSVWFSASSDSTLTAAGRSTFYSSDHWNCIQLKLFQCSKFQLTARLVTGTRHCKHITPVLRLLHWLPVRQRVSFEVATLVHRSLSGNSASYLANDCRLVADNWKGDKGLSNTI